MMVTNFLRKELNSPKMCFKQLVPSICLCNFNKEFLHLKGINKKEVQSCDTSEPIHIEKILSHPELMKIAILNEESGHLKITTDTLSTNSRTSIKGKYLMNSRSNPFRKFAIKIKLIENDEKEDYIVFDGPVCMPKTLLNTSGVGVLLEGASSMFFRENQDLKKDIDNLGTSLINLAVASDEGNLSISHADGEEREPKSVSEQLIWRVKNYRDSKDDLIPEKDYSEPTSKDKYHFLMVDMTTQAPQDLFENSQAKNALTKKAK